MGINPDGTFTIKGPIKIGGVILRDAMFSHGVKISGVDLSTLAGKELEVEKHDNMYEVKGFYVNK